MDRRAPSRPSRLFRPLAWTARGKPYRFTYGTVVLPLRPTNMRYRNSRIRAPIIEAMIPGPSPGSLYHPSARPKKPAKSAPATPMSMVTMIPPGSRPGMMSLAIAPTTNPMIKVHRNPIVPSTRWTEDIRIPGPGICEREHTGVRRSVALTAGLGPQPAGNSFPFVVAENVDLEGFVPFVTAEDPE